MVVTQELPPLVGAGPKVDQQGTSSHTVGSQRTANIFRKGSPGKEIFVVTGPGEVQMILEADNSRIDNDWGPAIKALLGPGAVGNQQGVPHTAARRSLCRGFTKEAILVHLPGIVKIMEGGLLSWASAQGAVPLLGEMKHVTSDVACLLVLGPVTDADRTQLRKDCTTLTAGFAGHEGDAASGPSMQARQRLLATFRRYIAPPSTAAGPEGTEGAAHDSSCPILRLNAAAKAEGEGMAVEELLDQCINLIQAGTETVPFTLANLVIQLGNHPDMLQKLVEEQKTLVKSHGAEITAAVLDGMVYGEAVAREGLRMHSPVPGVFRRPHVDIEVDGYRVPKASMMQLVLQQPVPQVLPEQAGFYPGRWLDASGQLVKWPTSFMPFGGGNRFCIGWMLARIQIKVMLALFVRHFACTQAGKPVNAVPTSELTHDDVVMMRFTSIARVPDDAVMMDFSHHARVL